MNELTLTDHVLRIADGAVIDLPHDLNLHDAVDRGPLTTWMVSWYPDWTVQGGWKPFSWPQSQPRGFMIPTHSATGDVIEIGIARVTPDGAVDLASAVRWFGWLNYGTGRVLVFKGRYSTRETAAEHAAIVVDLVRMSEIDNSKSFDLTQIDPVLGDDTPL